MTITIGDRLVKGFGGEIDSDLLRKDQSAFGDNATKHLTLDPRPIATSSAQGEMSAAQAAKLDTLAPLTSDAIATALDNAGVNWRGDGVTMSVLGTATGINANSPIAYDLGEPLDANAQYAFAFLESNKPFRISPQVSGAVLTNDTYAPEQTTAPTAGNSGAVGAVALQMSRPGAPAAISGSTIQFAHATIGIWRSATANQIYLYTTHSGSGVTVIALKFTGSGGGTAGTSNAATWARTGNTDDIPGTKFGAGSMAVIADATADISGFEVGNLIFNLADKHFYRIATDTTHAARPLRITFSPDDIAANNTSLITYGYARAAINTYANAAHGTLALAPNVQATLPGHLDALLSVSQDDFSEGVIFVGIDSTSTFVPARIRYRVVGGGPEREYAIGYDAGVTGGVHRYFSSSHFDSNQGNPWGLPEGATDDVEVDFDILDASGASIAPATATRTYLQRIDLPGTITGFDGDTNVVYGSHEAPQTQSGLLVDTVTGDEYFAKRSHDADLIIVEPVRAGSTYGLAPGNSAAFNAPSTLTRLTWDADTGLVDVEATTGAALGGWKKIGHLGDPADTQGSATRSARLVEVPASTTDLGTRRKRALLADWHTGLTRLTAAANADGDPEITLDGGTLKYDVSARKLVLTLDAPYSSRDDGQLIGMQRITPDYVNNEDVRAGIPDTITTYDGTVPSSGLWGTLADGLHPAWFNFSMRVAGDDDAQRTNSVVHAGYRADADEALWLVAWLDNEFTGTFLPLSLPSVGQEDYDPDGTRGVPQALKLIWASQAEIGGIWRHRYTLAGALSLSLPNTPRPVFSSAPNAPRYIGLVVTASGATNINQFSRSLEPVNYTSVEIEGVPIPLTMTTRRMVNANETPPRSFLRTTWESAAWGAGQEAPLAAAGEYAVNVANDRGVRGRPYLSATHPPASHSASGFRLFDASDTAVTTTDTARAWWEARSRGLPTTNAEPRDQGVPWRLRRWGGEEHRAVPAETDMDVQGYAAPAEAAALAGAFVVGNWSRTVLRQLASEGESTVIDQVVALAESGGHRDWYIRAAVAGELEPVHIRIINRTRGWTADSRDVAPASKTQWRVRLSTDAHPIEAGDEIRLRLRAPSSFLPDGHTPIAWDHSVTVWEDV